MSKTHYLAPGASQTPCKEPALPGLFFTRVKSHVTCRQCLAVLDGKA